MVGPPQTSAFQNAVRRFRETPIREIEQLDRFTQFGLTGRRKVS